MHFLTVDSVARTTRMDDAPAAAAAAEPAVAMTAADKRFAAALRQRKYQTKKNDAAKIAEKLAEGYTGPVSPWDKEKGAKKRGASLSEPPSQAATAMLLAHEAKRPRQECTGVVTGAATARTSMRRTSLPRAADSGATASGTGASKGKSRAPREW